MGSFALELSQTLAAIDGGDELAASRLLPLIYDELRGRARIIIGDERRGHTLTATALVHEAYLKVSGRQAGFKGRKHLFHATAQAMRQIIIDHARGRARAKRGGARGRVGLEQLGTVDAAMEEKEFDWLALDEALDELRKLDERRHQVVMLRFFAGQTNEAIGKVLGVDEATVRRAWNSAQAWLMARLRDVQAP